MKKDSLDQIYFGRQLESAKKKSYDKKYPEFKQRTLIPTSLDADPGAETIKYEQFDASGVAIILSSYGDDIPTCSVKGKEFIGVVRGLANKYEYSIQDVTAARLANKDIKQSKANAARKGMLQLEQSIAYLGDSTHNLVGFFNNPNVTRTDVPSDGAGALTTFASKSNTQILRDLNECANAINVVTKGVESPDTFLLPLAQYNFIASTPMDNTSPLTILEFFIKNNPFIKQVTWVNQLDTAGALGVARMIAYRRDPDYLTLEIPKDMETLAPQINGLVWEVNNHQRIGGVSIYYPLSVHYCDGI